MQEDSLGLVEELDLLRDVVPLQRPLLHLIELGFRHVDSRDARIEAAHDDRFDEVLLIRVSVEVRGERAVGRRVREEADVGQSGEEVGAKGRDVAEGGGGDEVLVGKSRRQT